MKEIPKAYNPQEVEDAIYKKWEESGLFNPDNLKLPKNADYFSISMPPPNRTGTLHTGHAIMLAYQDLMVRYNRLLGKKTLWLPGTDHAAIATQAKVEKILYKEEKKTRHDLGKEKFLERVVAYAEASKNIINTQVRKMGSSCDWSRERYTLDDGLNQVVKQAFIKMYNEGLIYRGYRIVNWCPQCLSTLSDDEVEYKETTGKFYTFKYAKDFPIVISTTRPETKLGDTAVAVHPDDKRYQKYIGQTFTIDLGHGSQTIKIIGDESVDPNFGTGALGVTPAHSKIDYEMAVKNLLPIIKVIGEDGKMTKEAGIDYEGLPVLEARDKFVQWLEAHNLMTKIEDVPQNLTVCYRCGTTIEPLPSLQWFIDVNKQITLPQNKYFQNKSIKEVALQVVKNGEIKIIPERFEQDYYRWLDNLRDWCISRQIWFGHQIPVWYKKAKQGAHIKLVRLGDVKVETEKREINYKDVLNTPLSTAGKEQMQAAGIALKAKAPSIVIAPTEKAGQESGEIIAQALNCRVQSDIRLNGINLGQELMLSEKDIKAAYGVDIKRIIDYHWNVPYTKGESFVDVINKTRELLIELLDNYDGQNIVVVASGSSYAAIRYLTEGIWPTELIAFSAQQDIELREIVLPSVAKPDNGSGWQQDPDTLDTWFSSGLWTFSTLMDKNYKKYDTWEEWVKGSKDLAFHPTNVMETGYDILFFWVARMIIQTTFLRGEIPFETVYLHGLVRDEQGRKMSKSLGNVVDPLDLIPQYGTDALRLSMITGTAAGADSRLYNEKVEGFRNFVNKLWNISRYILTSVKKVKQIKKQPEVKTLADEWILNRFNVLVTKVTAELDRFDFSMASDLLREFTWSDLADWYLEISKLQAQSPKLRANTETILLYILERLLIMWHPFIPFVTEAIWENFEAKKMLMVESWPASADGSTKLTMTASADFNLVIDIISTLRNLRGENKIEPAKKINVQIIAGKKAKLIKEQAEIIKGLARVENLEILAKAEKPKQALAGVVADVEVYILLAGLVDADKERERIGKEIEQIKNYIATLNKKLGNKEFVDNAPKQVVAKEQEKLQDQQAKLGKLEEQLKAL